MATDGMHQDMSYPATVSSFALDKYEVTVGRFRSFVDAGKGTQQHPPATGDGAHVLIPGSGWDAAWNASLPTNTAALIGTGNVACGGSLQTWTATPGSNESLPMTCVTWLQAFAFCAWDEGFLPSEAEWNYAAAGGNEQRAYPWSVPPSELTIDCSYASLDYFDAQCMTGSAPSRVGGLSPKGDSRWGQADMSGSVSEWTLDAAGTYLTPCNDCAHVAFDTNHVLRGGDFQTIAVSLRTAFRSDIDATFRGSVGVRCARDP
jgi:formylglycine-generating enzyme required for sulfatase activity